MFNKKSCSLAVVAALCSTQLLAADIVASTANVTMTGKITDPNVCTLTLDKSAITITEKTAASLNANGETLVSQDITPRVSCQRATIFGLKFSSSLSTDSANSQRFGVIKQGSADAAYVYITPKSTNTTGGNMFGAVGNANFSALTTSTNIGFVRGNIQSTTGAVNNIVVPRHPAFDTVMSLTSDGFPLTVKVDSAPKSTGWATALAGGELNLANTTTIELHIQ